MNMQHDLPPITLATCDYNRLMFVAMIGQKQQRPGTDFLLAELRRAELCHPAALPEDIVSTNCRVFYRVDREPETRVHVLVHPDDLIWPGAEVSVATPIGTALLGLAAGDRMPFLDTDGRLQEVYVEGVGPRFLDGAADMPGTSVPSAWSGRAAPTTVPARPTLEEAGRTA